MDNNTEFVVENPDEFEKVFNRAISLLEHARNVFQNRLAEVKNSKLAAR
jgi:hypothetical protein